MINEKIGNIIRKLRKENCLTQKQLADKMNLSDKTISKWERGLGCPDVSLLVELSNILEVDIGNLLSGNLINSKFVEGNMKKTKFYVCPMCNNITLCTGKAEIICCGRKIKEPQLVKTEDNEEMLTVETSDGETYITSNHPMIKEHYISFVAFVNGDSLQIIKQYPEWDMQIRISNRGHGKLIWHCTKHGLFYQLI